MRVLMTIICIMCASLCVYAGAELSADKADLIEFASVEEAQAFGWEGVRGAVLKSPTESKVGEHALYAVPGPEHKPFMGVGLRHDIDLTGAGPDDKIIFFVKQNFGRDLFINMHVPKGNVYRVVKVQQGQWTRVEVDLDLTKWYKTKQVEKLDAWPLVPYLHIYNKGFEKDGQYMLMDGFSVFVGGKPAVVRSAPKAGQE